MLLPLNMDDVAGGRTPDGVAGQRSVRAGPARGWGKSIADTSVPETWCCLSVCQYLSKSASIVSVSFNTF